MNFELSGEQLDIKKAAREFAEGEFPKVAEECDRNERFPMELWKKACDLGFVGVSINEKYGGAGLGSLEAALIMEEFWRVDPGCGTVLLATYGSELIELFGNEDQKVKFLSPLPRGGAIMGVAITGLNVNLDFEAIETLATRKGADYVIKGEKNFVLNGNIADYLIVFCLTSQSSTDQLEKCSAIVVETNRNGIERNKVEDKLGIRASDIADIKFVNARLPKENLIGNEGMGRNYLPELLIRTGIYSGAQAIGVAQGALDRSVKYVKQRIQFGHPIGWFKITRSKIAEMATWIEAARYLLYGASWNFDRNKLGKQLVSMAKLFSTDIAVKITGEAIQLHGGYGYSKDLDIELLYRDAQVGSTWQGTKELEKDAIAESFLGKLD